MAQGPASVQLEKSVAAFRAGRLQEALEAVQAGLLIDPDDADLLHNGGALFAALGRPADAEAAYRRALALRPESAGTRFNLGNLLKSQGRSDEAVAQYREALAQQPNYAVAWSNLANLLAGLGRSDEAEAAYRRAAEISPRFAGNWSNFGNLLQAQKRYDEAEEAYRKALAVDAAHAEAQSNLGVLLKAQGRWSEAEAAYRAALAVRPDNAVTWSNLGVLLLESKRLDDAEAACRRAIELRPGYADGWSNFGNLLQTARRFDEAESAYRRALQLAPGQGDPVWNLSLLLLRLGKFEEGWLLHEARQSPTRRERRTMSPPTATDGPGLPPVWQGEPLVGKSLLIWPEQGHGDEIQFVRYLPMLRAQAAVTLTLACKPALKPLFEAQGLADRVLSTDEWQPGMAGEFDFWCHAMSLPLRFGTTLASIPGRVPYLLAPAQRIARWTPRLPDGLRVGVVWRGSATHRNDAARSLGSLADLAPLWAVPGVSFVSLQKGAGEEECESLRSSQPLAALGAAMDDFADAAGILAQLDLLISVDTAAAHLAAALGTACWVLLPEFGTDWRWLEQREDSPWYPGVMRLFRQQAEEPWPAVAHRVATALAQWATPRLVAGRPGPRVCLERSAALFRQGRVPEALAIVDAGLELDAANVDLLNNRGVFLVRLGRPAEAEAAYRRAIEISPGYESAWSNLGNVLRARGATGEAEAAYRCAISLRPDNGDAWCNLGNMYRETGRLAEAEAAYRRAIDAKADIAEAHSNLGVVLRDAGRLAEAEAAYREALRLRPDYAEAWSNLGNLLKARGSMDEAIVAFRQALVRQPGRVDAWVILGSVLRDAGRHEEAEAALRKAIELSPRNAQSWARLGLLLADRKRDAEAAEAYARALDLDPNDALIHYNHGVFLAERRRVEEAEAAYRRTVALQPDHAAAHFNLGTLMHRLNRIDEAEACYRRSLEIRPNVADVTVNLALLCLRQGRYAEGWPLNEARYASGKTNCQVFPPSVAGAQSHLAQWQGEDLDGKSLLIWPEQGFGDQIQFLRYAPLLRSRKPRRLVLACKSALKALFAAQGIADEVIDADQWRPANAEQIDYWVYPQSLPLHFGTSLDTIPAGLPYLKADPQRIEKWRPRLPDAGRRVGLVWKGQPTHGNDANRSLASLRLLAPLWKVPGVSFVSLQKGPGEGEALSDPPGPLLHLGREIADFADTAAILCQLDLLICVDTGIAHLAGALGRPCWVMLPDYETDWRWLERREDSPWYPGVMRLFRQAADGAWEPVIERMAAALREPRY